MECCLLQGLPTTLVFTVGFTFVHFSTPFPGSNSVWLVGDPLLDQHEARVLEDAGALDTVLRGYGFRHVQSNQEENQHQYS